MRNPTRQPRPPRAATGAPLRVRTTPHGDQTGGSQADSHEAAELSDEGSPGGTVGCGAATRGAAAAAAAQVGGGRQSATVCRPGNITSKQNYPCGQGL